MAQRQPSLGLTKSSVAPSSLALAALLLCAAPAAPARAPTDPSPVACNIAGVAYWSSSRMYCNLLRVAGSWATADDGNKPLANFSLATGLPLDDFTVLVAVVPDTEAFGGTFALSGTCAAPCPDLKIAGWASPVTFSGLAVSGADFSATLNFPAPAGSQIAFSVRGTNGGVTALAVLQQGCGASDTLTPAFLAHTARCDAMRFMDFSAANDNPAVAWANRTAPGWANWAGSVRRPDGTPDQGGPWEVAVELCNAAGRDMWVNVPLHANDDYVSSLAHLLLATLDADLNIYVEYSNELWHVPSQNKPARRAPTQPNPPKYNNL